MKINLPVTQKEVELKDTSQIVSKTDLKGRITFVNREFIEISGFTEEELIGQNHNIVRHPDMPPEAYDDLWNTVKSGKPWIGIVKNRCKNGDHYWVEACITPVSEGGQVAGYISVRGKPTRQQIEGALNFHKALREGQDTIQAMVGKVRSIKRNFTLKARIISIFVVVMVSGVSLGYIGIKGIEDTNIAVHELYQDRVIPLQQLKSIADMYAVNIVDTSHKVRNGNLSWAQGETNVASALAEVDKQWKAYNANAHVQEEKNLVADIEPLFVKANAATAALQSILRAQDANRLAAFASAELYPAIDPLSDKINALTQLQLKVSAQVFADAEADYQLHRNLGIVFLLLGIAITALLGRLLYGAIMPRVNSARTYLLQTAQGIDHASVLRTGHRDELTDVMDAYRALKTRIDFDHSESISGINRIKAALDNSAMAITVSNEDNLLTYMNSAAKALFQDLSIGIAMHHPGFSVDKMLGTRVAQYLEDEGDKANFVMELSGPKQIETVIAEQHLQLLLNPVYDEDNGSYLGRMTQWTNRTAEVLAEQEVARLVDAAVAGNLAQRVDTKILPPGFILDTGKGINNMLDAVIGPLNVAAKYVDDIAKGNIPAKITDTYNGDFNALKNNLNTCIDAVNALVEDAAGLAQAAVDGKLETRADASRHQGDFRKIVEGVNHTLDAVIGPLNVAAQYVDNISKGNIPARITENYNGDFNSIKDNLNTCIESINALVVDVNQLSQAANEGRVSVRADASQHQGDFRKIVEGVNETLEMIVGPIGTVKSAVETIN
ncbi:MAG: PAS domain-containing protein, partial [Methylophilaceae bacterium]